MSHATNWANRVYSLPAFNQVAGSVHLCGRSLKPVCVADPKKEEKKKEAPKEAPVKAEKKEVAKPKDNVESLPPTSFDLFNFKTFYVNHPDKRGEAVNEWYKTLDWEGWSFWYLHYDKYEGEGV